MPEPLLAPSFVPLVVAFADCFTSPSFETFEHLVAGWVLCLGKHTVTGVLRAAGAVGPRYKHYSCFHRFFNVAAWHMEEVSRQLLGLVLLQLVPENEHIVAAMDDTLGHHTGKHIRAASMHRDELLSTRTKVVWHWGHVWVVLAVVVHVPLCKKHFALPVLWRLYRSQKLCKKEGRTFFKKTELAAQMVRVLAAAVPERTVVILADSAYANSSVIKALPPNVHFIGRSRLDAALYAPPRRNLRGRPRVKGERLVSPGARAKSGRGWRRLRATIYGETATIEVKVFDALWYVVAGGRLLRFVLIRGWPGHDNDDVLVTTDLTLTAQQVVERYCLRWKLEVTFEDAKGRLGFEDPQNRTDLAVERTAPMALCVYSLTVIWFATVGHRLPGARVTSFPWYHKTVPTFSDMLAALRREAWRQRILDPAHADRRLQKSVAPLLDVVATGT